MGDRHQLGPAAESIALGPHEMELRMLAVRDHVPGLRALVAERAMRLDHDLDFIDDVRLAVDKVCAIMLASCSPADVMSLRLFADTQRMEISACVPMRVESVPRVHDPGPDRLLRHSPAHTGLRRTSDGLGVAGAPDARRGPRPPCRPRRTPAAPVTPRAGGRQPDYQPTVNFRITNPTGTARTPAMSSQESGLPRLAVHP